MTRTLADATSVLVAALALSGCHLRANAAPLLTAVSPDRVSIGGGDAPLLVVRGHGFAARNIVHFGALRIPDVPRTNDSVMQFAVPTDDTFLPSRGPVPVRPIAAGTYEMRIENARGTSNALSVTVVAGSAR